MHHVMTAPCLRHLCVEPRWFPLHEQGQASFGEVGATIVEALKAFEDYKIFVDFVEVRHAVGNVPSAGLAAIAKNHDSYF